MHVAMRRSAAPSEKHKAAKLPAGQTARWRARFWSVFLKPKRYEMQYHFYDSFPRDSTEMLVYQRMIIYVTLNTYCTSEYTYPLLKHKMNENVEKKEGRQDGDQAGSLSNCSFTAWQLRWKRMREAVKHQRVVFFPRLTPRLARIPRAGRNSILSNSFKI